MRKSRHAPKKAAPRGFLRSPAAGRWALGFLAAMLLLVLSSLTRGLLAESPSARRASLDSTTATSTTLGPAVPHLLEAAPDVALESKPAAPARGTLRLRSAPELAAPDVTSPGQLLLTLGGVIAVLVVVLVGTVKLLRRARLAPSRQKLLELVDALPLGQKRFVYVVNFRDRTLILGTGSDEIQLLAEYGEEDLGTAASEPENARVAAPATGLEASRGPARSAKPAAASRIPAMSLQATRKPSTTPAHGQNFATTIEDAEDLLALATSAGSGPLGLTLRPPSDDRARVERCMRDRRASEVQEHSPRESPKPRSSAAPLLEKARKLESVAASEVKLPPGAHRVPAAFRHLLKAAFEREEPTR